MLILLAAAGLRFRSQMIEQNRETLAHGLVKGVLDADIAQVPEGIKEMADYRALTKPLLETTCAEADRAIRDPETPPAEKVKQARRQLRASLALLPEDPKQEEHLFHQLLEAEPQVVVVIILELIKAGPSPKLKEQLWTEVEKPGKGPAGRRLRAAAALANYDASDKGRWQ